METQKNCFEIQKTLIEEIDFVDQEYSYDLGRPSCSFFSRHEECATVKSSLNASDMVLTCTRSDCDKSPYDIDQELELPWIKQETPLAQQSAKDLELDPRVKSVLDKEPKLKHLLKIFLNYSAHHVVIGPSLEVKADDSHTDTKKRLNDIFEKWIASTNKVFWRTMLKVCNDFPDNLGRAKSDLLKFLLSDEAQEEYS